MAEEKTPKLSGTLELVVEAIKSSEDRKGVSIPALKVRPLPNVHF